MRMLSEARQDENAMIMRGRVLYEYVGAGWPLSRVAPNPENGSIPGWYQQRKIKESVSKI